MKRQIIVRPRALADLREIWAYTLRNWGRAQADDYVREIESSFAKVAEEPELGSDRSYVRPGVRKITVGSHAIYYLHDDETLRVSRILHVRRDAERAL